MASPITTVIDLLARHGLTPVEMSKPVDNDFIRYIVDHMDRWEEICLYLIPKAVDREDIKDSSGNRTLKEKRILMIETWIQQNGNQAYLFKLVEAFLQAGRRDLADKACDYFNDRIKPKLEHYYTPRTGTPTCTDIQDDENPEIQLQVIPEYEDQQLQNTPMGLQNEDEDEETDDSTALIPESRQETSNKANCCSTITWFLCICCCFFILPTVIAPTLITFGFTTYGDHIPPPGTVVLVQDYAILMPQEFNPFYVGAVTFSSENDCQLYKALCRDLKNYNKSIDQFLNLTVTQDKTYPLASHYLQNRSRLEYHFDLSSHNKEPESECSAVLYIFNDLSFYKSFIDYGTKSGYNSTYCLTGETSNYTLEPKETTYFFTGLYIPAISTLNTIGIETTGFEVDFNTSQYSPYCAITKISDCTIKFEGTHSPASHNNICILGVTPNNVSQITYEAKYNSNTNDKSIGFIIPGFFSLICLLGACYSFLKIGLPLCEHVKYRELVEEMPV